MAENLQSRPRISEVRADPSRNVHELRYRLGKRKRTYVVLILSPLAWCAAVTIDMNLRDLEVLWLALALGLIVDLAVCLSFSLCSQERWCQIVGTVLGFAVLATVAGLALVQATVLAVRDLMFQGQLPSMGSRSVQAPSLTSRAHDWSIAWAGLVLAVLGIVAMAKLLAVHRQLQAVEPPPGRFRFGLRAIGTAIAWVLLAVLGCIASLCVR